MVKCEDCLNRTLSGSPRKRDSLIDVVDWCMIKEKIIQTDKEIKCEDFKPFPERNAREMFR